MDALSQALGSVRMTGAIFVDAICTAPWGFSVPAMERVASPAGSWDRTPGWIPSGDRRTGTDRHGGRSGYLDRGG
jgi:hypothetical protein